MSVGGATVGVASCGRPQALKRCLDALGAQTMPAAEVIVVDQAPTPRARVIVETSGVKNASYVSQARLGLSASRNLVLRIAQSPTLAVTDDDCAPDPGWLEALTAALERAPRPGAATGPILPLGDPPRGGFAISLRESITAMDHVGRRQPWGVGSGANFAAPVGLLRSHGGWDERLGTGSPGMAAEDADLIYRLLAGGAVVRYEPECVVRHAWQSPRRRLETRWSYGYGIGAMCGLHLRQRDAFALRMLAGYLRLHVRPLVGAVLRRDGWRTREHLRALASTAPGLVYGLRSVAIPAEAGARGAQ